MSVMAGQLYVNHYPDNKKYTILQVSSDNGMGAFLYPVYAE